MEPRKNDQAVLDAGGRWPMSLTDPALAIHEAAENGNCEAWNPYNCFAVSHRAIEATIEHYKVWLKLRGVDVDELLASRSISSEEVGR
jgi:hypothetical protein